MEGQIYVLIADLLDVEKTTLGTNVALPDILYPVHDRSADCPCNTVVIRLAYAADRRYVGLVQEVLRVIFETGSISDNCTRIED